MTPIAYVTGSTAPSMWQMVSGAQGSVVTVRTLDTDITGLNVTTVYQDRNAASPAQCTGDAAAYGQNGVNLTSPVNNVPVTDPTLTATPGQARHQPHPVLPGSEPLDRGRGDARRPGPHAADHQRHGIAGAAGVAATLRA